MTSETHVVYNERGGKLGELHIRTELPILVADVVDGAWCLGVSSSDGKVLDGRGEERYFVSRDLSISDQRGSVGRVATDGAVYDRAEKLKGRISPMLNDRAVGGCALLFLL